jgi:hypothetical protein
MDQNTPEREHVEHLFAAIGTALLLVVVSIMDASEHGVQDWLVHRLGLAAYMKNDLGDLLSNIILVVPTLAVLLLALIAIGWRASIRAVIFSCAIGLAAIAWSNNVQIKTAPVVSVAWIDSVWAVSAIAAGFALVAVFDRIAIRCWRMIAERFHLPQLQLWSETPLGCRVKWGLCGAAALGLGVWEIAVGFIREMAGLGFGAVFDAFCLLLGGFAVASAILSAVLPAMRRPPWLQHTLGWIETP